LLIKSLESTRNSKQPAEIKLPGINDEFIILPASNKELFFGLKNKILTLSRIELDLQERVKELECLYSVTKESDTLNNLEDFLQNCIKIVKAGFQYPEDTVVNIEIANKMYGNKNDPGIIVADYYFANILLDGRDIGKLNVNRISGPEFLIEERNMINEIANRISHIIENDKKAKDLKTQQKILKLKNEALIKMTEECSRKREELSAFFKAMSDNIVVIDKEFNIIMSNKDVIGNSGKCYNKLFNFDSPCKKCSGVIAFNTKKDSILTMELNDRHYTLRANPIMSAEGKVERVLEVCRDVTDRNRMEAQLIQSYKLASLGKLVAGVAHEINNPNTFILGNLKIFQESLTDILPILDEYYEKDKDLKIARLNYDIFKENISVLVNDMINGANRTKKIVGDLRNFAKKDEDGLTDLVNLNELIKNNLNLTNKQIKKHARLEIELDENIPQFKGNINKLEQVVLNLIMNASEAMENEEGLIKIKTGFENTKNEVYLIVSDNGCGMSEATLKNIFDPFFTTKRSCGGIGLGLSITYGIIKDHEGAIEVNSKVGDGTTFFIHIPVKQLN
jgi:signal transduction histidine kinase